jgi:cytochrome c-type biogenesis protein CcmH/NrfG
MALQRLMRGMVAAAAAVLVVPLFGQPSTGTSSGSSNSGAKTTGPSTSSGTPNSSAGLNQPTTQRPLRVSGRVAIDDGSPLSFPATIERVCAGNRHAEGYTDIDGNFALVLGQHPDVIGDATETPTSSNRLSLPPGMSTPGSTSGNSRLSTETLTGDSHQANCELRASLSGYTSDTINLATRTSMDNPDIGTILLHRMGAPDTAMTVTATTLKAPKEARRALHKGLELSKKNRPEEAIASLKDAVKVYPEFAFAWYELGKLQLENDHTPDAHESFAAAAKAEPRWPEPYLRLAVMAVMTHDWKQVADNTEHVLHLNTFQYPQAYFLNGAANFNLHHIDLAEEDALAAEKLDMQHQYPQIEKLLGSIYSERHRYADAAGKFRSYLMLAPGADDIVFIRQQLAAMEALAAESSRIAQQKAQQ